MRISPRAEKKSSCLPNWMNTKNFFDIQAVALTAQGVTFAIIENQPLLTAFLAVGTVEIATKYSQFSVFDKWYDVYSRS